MAVAAASDYASCPPGPRLAPFITQLWTARRPSGLPHPREWNLPTGLADLVLPLDRPALRRFTGVADTPGHTLAGGLLQGAMQQATLRCTATASVVLGVQFRPAGLVGWLAQPAHELAGQAVPLDTLWPGLADAVREAVWAGGVLAGPQVRLLLQQALLARLRPDVQPDTLVERALRLLQAGHKPAAVQQACGLSAATLHRRFRQACGLAPQQWLALQSLGTALRLAHDRLQAPATPLPTPRAAPDWAGVAQAAGYADQAHLVRQFRRLTGTTPGAWQRRSTPWAQHMAEWTPLQPTSPGR